ncbi:MAG: MerR family transcriptional regulator [Bacillota bacterium]|nr:MerR family transcriptional regulator [Bacillota bacterium]
MDNLFKIGEIAELFHLNIRTLRYYDEIGLLKPELVDEDTGYRYYSTTQFEQLNTIRYLRELKVPLTEIKGFLQYRDIDGVKKILTRQIKEAEEKQQELEIIKKKIRNRIGQIEAAETSRKDQPEILQLPRRKAVLLKYTTRPDSDLEYPIRMLEKNTRQATIFLGKVGLSIEKKRMLTGDFGQYDSIFLLLDPGEEYEGKSITIVKGDFAVIRFNGTHREAEKNYEKLTEHIRESGYRIAGDSLEITIIDAGFTRDESQYVTEIQIPVKPAEAPTENT